MTDDVHYNRGILRGTIAAGPTFLVSYALVILTSTPLPTPIEPTWWPLLMLLVPAMAGGAIVGFLPNLFGAALLARLGAGNVALRLPVVWALAGGMAAGGTAAASQAGATFTAAFAATGALCALLCRSGTRWHD